MRETRMSSLAITALLALEAQRRSGGSWGLAEVGEALRADAERDPLGALVKTVLGASAAFYLAERGANPKVQSFDDALVFCTTCISVGYSDIFARTPMGKRIAATLMTVGPALSARALERPAS
jgi:voltage-gated potassium channel